MPIADVLDLLRCPHCGSPLLQQGATLRCPQGHAFDVARQGYVNLLPGGPPRNADTAAMVAARERFLSAGHYRPLLAGLCEAIDGLGLRSDAVLIDAGAGPGWYLAGLLDQLLGQVPSARGLATDVSVAAVRRAARAHPRMGAVVADSWAGLPVRDGVADVVLSVFAPRNPADAARLLRPGGHLVVLAAEPDHLATLRDRLGLLGVEPAKHQRLLDSLPPTLTPTGSRRLTAHLTLTPAAVADLVAMGPNAFHHSENTTDDRPGSLDVDVEVAVRLTLARRT